MHDLVENSPASKLRTKTHQNPNWFQNPVCMLIFNVNNDYDEVSYVPMG